MKIQDIARLTDVMFGHQTSIHQYIKKNGRKIGVMVTCKVPGESIVRFGIARCNTNKDEFDANQGLNTAVGRACKGNEVIKASKPAVINEIEIVHPALWSHKLLDSQVLNFLIRSSKYFRVGVVDIYGDLLDPKTEAKLEEIKAKNAKKDKTVEK